MKKQSPILQMFRGERGNGNKIAVSEAYMKALSAHNKRDEAFAEKLKEYPELLEMYNEIDGDCTELEILEFGDAYAEGFRFGVLLALDVVGIN